MSREGQTARTTTLEPDESVFDTVNVSQEPFEADSSEKAERALLTSDAVAALDADKAEGKAEGEHGFIMHSHTHTGELARFELQAPISNLLLVRYAQGPWLIKQTSSCAVLGKLVPLMADSAKINAAELV